MDVNLTISGEVSVLKLQPRDVILVRVDKDISPEQGNEILRVIQNRFQDLGYPNKVMLFSRWVEILVARRERQGTVLGRMSGRDNFDPKDAMPK